MGDRRGSPLPQAPPLIEDTRVFMQVCLGEEAVGMSKLLITGSMTHALAQVVDRYINDVQMDRQIVAEALRLLATQVETTI